MTETMCAKEGCKEYCFTTIWCEAHNWDVIQDIRNSAVKLHVSREKQKLKAQILEMIENIPKELVNDEEISWIIIQRLKQKVEKI